jgi:hypothetical protein
MSENEKDDLFSDGEAEILEGPTLDEKLDTIIELLRKNQREHEEIGERLDKIEINQKLMVAGQNALVASYKAQGLKLGQLLEQCDERHAPAPLRLVAELVSKEPQGNGEDR